MYGLYLSEEFKTDMAPPNLTNARHGSPLVINGDQARRLGGSGGSDEPPLPHSVLRSALEKPTANLWSKWLSLWSDVSGDSLET